MNTPEQAIKLIESVCNYYGITNEQLRTESKIAINKDGNLVRLSEIRMALAYFLFKYCPLRLTEIAPMVGYKKHSTISTYRRVVEMYIDTEDPHFFPYYIKTIDLASDLDISMKLERVISRSSRILFKDYKKLVVI